MERSVHPLLSRLDPVLHVDFFQLLKPYALKEDLAVFVRPWMGDMWLALFSMGKKPMISLKISGTSRCVSSSVLQGPKLSSAPKEPDRSSEL
jgi:hypothetical protein